MYFCRSCSILSQSNLTVPRLPIVEASRVDNLIGVHHGRVICKSCTHTTLRPISGMSRLPFRGHIPVHGKVDSVRFWLRVNLVSARSYHPPFPQSFVTHKMPPHLLTQTICVVDSIFLLWPGYRPPRRVRPVSRARARRRAPGHPRNQFQLHAFMDIRTFNHIVVVFSPQID